MRGQQQAHDEAIAVALLLLLAFLAFVLVLFSLASAAVGGAVGVLQSRRLVAAIGLVKQEQPGAIQRLTPQEVAKESLEPVSGNAGRQVAKKAHDVAAMAFMAGHAGGNERGGEAAFRQDAGKDEARQEESVSSRRDPGQKREEGIAQRQRMSENHGEKLLGPSPGRASPDRGMSLPTPRSFSYFSPPSASRFLLPGWCALSKALPGSDPASGRSKIRSK